MAFFTDILKGITGQSDIPQFSLMSPSDLTGALTEAAPGVAQANQAYAIPYANLQRQVENIYDPNQGKLREATTSSILKELGLGGQLPADVQQQVIQNALENNAATGFGVSQAGRGVTARDLGLTGLDVLNNRINRASSYVRSAPIIQPQGAITGSDIADQILGNQNSRNSFNTFASNMNSQNRVNMIRQPLDLLSEAVGTAAGFGSILKGGGIGGSSPSILSYLNAGGTSPRF